MPNKKSVLRSLLSRAFTHTSNDKDKKIELDNLTKILIQNNYPECLIKSIINECKRKYSNPNSHQKAEFNLDQCITIPYFQNISESIGEILSEHDIKVVFKRGHTIKNMLSPSKKPILNKGNIVYKC